MTIPNKQLRKRLLITGLQLALVALLGSCGGAIPSDLLSAFEDNTQNQDQAAAPQGSNSGTPVAGNAANTTSAFGIPAGLTGTVDVGSAVFSSSCSTCHSSLSPKTFGQLQSAMSISAMRSLNLSQQQLADLTAYVNRNSITSPSPAPAPSGGGQTVSPGPSPVGSPGNNSRDTDDDDDDDSHDDDDDDDSDDDSDDVYSDDD